MQKILIQSHIFGSYAISKLASSAAFAGVLAILFLFAGISIANADTTYVVDATSPNGTCGAVCQQLQAYLNGAGTNVSGYTGNTNNSYGSNNSGSNPYFSQVGGNGSNNSNPSSTYGANGSNYTPYPYMIYNYYNNPNQSGVPNNYGAYNPNQGYGSQNSGTYNPYGNSNSQYGQTYNPYSNRVYVQYGQNGSPTTSGTGKGFTLTSGH